MSDAKTQTIINTIQSWLDWQERHFIEESEPLSDGSYLMTVPHWPSRGQLKEWVSHLNSINISPPEGT